MFLLKQGAPHRLIDNIVGLLKWIVVLLGQVLLALRIVSEARWRDLNWKLATWRLPEQTALVVLWQLQAMLASNSFLTVRIVNFRRNKLLVIPREHCRAVVLINTAYFGSENIDGGTIQIWLVSLVLLLMEVSLALLLMLIIIVIGRRSRIHYLTIVVRGGWVSRRLVVRNDRRVDENLLVLGTKSDDAMLGHMRVDMILVHVRSLTMVHLLRLMVLMMESIVMIQLLMLLRLILMLLLTCYAIMIIHWWRLMRWRLLRRGKERHVLHLSWLRPLVMTMMIAARLLLLVVMVLGHHLLYRLSIIIGWT